jgi:ABC-type sulfate transport system permease component
MIASEIKRFGIKMAIAVLLLIIGLVLLANVRKVSAANISDTITSPDTTEDHWNLD